MLIDPDAFETGFTAWVGSLVAGFEREVVAINGKTVRRLFDHGREQSPRHLVSAWAKLVKVPLAQRLETPAEASEQGLVLGQRRCWWQVRRDHRRARATGPTRVAEQPNSRCRTAS